MPKSKEKAGVKNWYEVIPKKFITSTHNPHYDQKNCHYIKIPFRAIILGNSGAGKTQTLIDIINNMQNTFEKIIICCKCKQEPLYQWLEEKLGKDGLTIVEGIQNLPSVDTFSVEVQSLVILDDLCLESAKSQQPVCDFFIRARKKSVSMIYITQSYFKCPKTIRLNITYLFIKQVSSLLDLTNILKDYSLGASAKDMKSMYRTSTAERSNFFLIDVDGPPDKRYRFNFDRFFSIPSDSDSDSDENITVKEL